jgi:hypothetical protein
LVKYLRSNSKVLLGERFEAKLTDFGLARIVIRGSPANSHVSTQGVETCKK